jgi:hypothetical protein
MELLDRYLQAVKKHLPWQRQEDIAAELKANLEAQLEDKEAELGRPLTQGEAEDWLRELGPPMQVAARYQPQQYLIGPAIFPTYWYVLQLAFTWVLIIYSIVSAVAMFAGGKPSATALLEAVLRVPVVLMTTAAWVTLIFAVVEWVATHYPGKLKGLPMPNADWSPSALPPLERDSAAGKKPRSFARAVAEVVFGFLGLLWLLLVPRYPFLLLGPGAAYLPLASFQPATVLVQFYWYVIAVNVLQLGWRAENLWRGSWRLSRTAQEITLAAMGLIPLVVLLAAPGHVYLTLKHPELDQLRHSGSLTTIDQAIYGFALVIFVLTVVQLVWHVGRMVLKGLRRRATQMR